jgi:hypothetical protein
VRDVLKAPTALPAGENRQKARAETLGWPQSQTVRCEEERHCTYDVTLGRVHITIVAVEKQ